MGGSNQPRRAAAHTASDPCFAGSGFGGFRMKTTAMTMSMSTPAVRATMKNVEGRDD